MKFLAYLVIWFISMWLSVVCFAFSSDKTPPLPEVCQAELSNCSFTNPLRDLPWLVKLHKAQPALSIYEYQKGADTYFKIFNCAQTNNRAYWYDCQGNYKGRTSQNDQDLSNYIARGAKFKKSWYTTCNKLTVLPSVCFTFAHFTAPKQNQYFIKGSNVQVQIESRFPGNIKYIDLYINSQFIRREVHSPYRWGSHRHLDNMLKGMSRGTYKLKAKIRDKCGGLSTITRNFRII